MTIGVAIALTMEEVCAEGSVTSRHAYKWHARNAVAYWGSERTLQSITRRDVQTWITSRRSMVAPATIGHELGFLSRVYRVAWDAGVDCMAPTRGLRRPKVNNARDRIMSEEEEKKLRSYLSAGKFSLIEFAYNTGIRRLEQMRLLSADVHFYKEMIEGKPTKIGLALIRDSKTGKGRQCPLNPVAADIASAWMSRYPGSYVFLSQRKGQRIWMGIDISRVFSNACKACGITGLRWHDLRHTAASRASANGAHVEDIQQLLGHQTKQQTERYITRGNTPMWRAAMSLMKGIPG